MKKIRRILIMIIIFIPFYINAQTYKYDDAINQGNNYIKSTIYNDRNKYLVTSNQKFIMNDNGSLSNNGSFTNGGFLNRLEYCISTGNSNCNGATYLIIPASYWTLSGNSTSRYYVNNVSGLNIQSDTYSSGVRVTEFVKPQISVTGNGTYNNPWVFDSAYLISLTSSNKNNAYFNINGEKVAKSEKYAEKRNNEFYAKFEFTVAHGYENNNKDGCNLKLLSSTKVNPSNSVSEIKKKYEIGNIKSDISCIAMFKKKEFTINYNCNSGNGNIPSVKVIYGDNFRLTSSLCTRSGYRQDGWLDGNNNRWNETSGPFNFDDGERGINNKTLTLKANWVRCNAGTYSNIANNTCDTCPAGRYSSAGAGSCSICQAGTYSAAGSSSCLTCAAGRYSAAGAGSCSICQAGTYSGTGASSCINCSTGYHSGAGASSCTANTYTIVYNANGGTGTTASSTHTYNVAKNLTNNGFSRSGYTFDGWATSAGGGVAYSNAQNVTNLTSTNGGTVTLYAHWKQDWVAVTTLPSGTLKYEIITMRENTPVWDPIIIADDSGNLYLLQRTRLIASAHEGRYYWDAYGAFLLYNAGNWRITNATASSFRTNGYQFRDTSGKDVYISFYTYGLASNVKIQSRK